MLTDPNSNAGLSLDEIRGLPPLWQVLQELKPKSDVWHKPRGRRPRFEVFDDQGKGNAAADLRLTKHIVAKLEQEYPNHPWGVEVSHDQGIAKVGIPLLMGYLDFFVLKLWEIKSDTSLRCVVEAGGEILERFRIPRSVVNFAALHDAMAKINLVDQRRGVIPV